MQLPITTIDKVENPSQGFAFAFIDGEDNKLKIKKRDSIIEFSNTLDDVQLLDLTDYTAFEVYPTDHVIPSGSTEIGLAVWNDETLTNMHEIPSSMTEEFSLWITKSRLESDIVIDWGDGTIEKLSELTPTNGTNNDGKIDVLVYVAHTYEVPNKPYIIKIYGKDYCAIRHNIMQLSENNRLMCRVLTHDLPIASHITNLASFCFNCERLLTHTFSSYSRIFDQIVNWSSTFSGCKNLKYSMGWSINRIVINYHWLFASCSSLIDTDFKIGLYQSGGLNGVFNGCSSLSKDISSLFYKTNLFVNNENVLINNLFQDCVCLTGTIPAKVLWNNPNATFTNTKNVFVGCSDAIRAQAPISWGGTASNDIIEA
jgi:hypothetical protein